MITISKDMKAVLSEGAILYTEDGKTFTLVKEGRIMAITEPGSLLEAFSSVATLGPVPDGTEPLTFTPLLVR